MSSTSSHDLRKARLERLIASNFLSLYNRAKITDFYALRTGTPPEPDLICKDHNTRQEIGIEVVTAYYDEDHAKSVWEPARGNPETPHSLTRPDHIENRRVLAHALKKLRQKTKKNYTRPGKLLLLIQIYPWRLYLSDVLESVEALRLPKSHRFDEIHLASQYEVYQLFPDREWIFH